MHTPAAALDDVGRRADIPRGGFGYHANAFQSLGHIGIDVVEVLLFWRVGVTFKPSPVEPPVMSTV